MKKETAKDKQMVLAKKALSLIKTDFLLALPYLGNPLSSLPYTSDLRTKTLGTDGEYLRFNPRFVINSFLDRNNILRRSYMQSLIHCIFCHMHKAASFPDKDLWNLSCDISAESIVDDMDNEAVYRLSSDYRDEVYKILYEKVEILTPERIYKYYTKNPLSYEQYQSLTREFALDDHEFWNLPENKNKLKSGSQNEQNWKNSAKHVQSDMASSREASDKTGFLEKILNLELNSRTNYEKLLEKYAVVREEMKIDLDSFDYGLYMYGLALYENMPLIEENEYSELKAVETLVIAIDTSASCQGDLVKRFLKETGSMLFKAQGFFKHTEVLIIECDNLVQREIFLDEPAKIKDYAENFVVAGGFGTDFRPVFNRVEVLQKQGRLRNLKGLMYFTDGYGVYPEKPTSYETSFVLWKDGAREENLIPSWGNIVYFD